MEPQSTKLDTSVYPMLKQNQIKSNHYFNEHIKPSKYMKLNVNLTR